MDCDFCGKDVMLDNGHYNAIDENKIMCIDCYNKLGDRVNDR